MPALLDPNLRRTIRTKTRTRLRAQRIGLEPHRLVQITGRVGELLNLPHRDLQQNVNERVLSHTDQAAGERRTANGERVAALLFWSEIGLATA